MLTRKCSLLISGMGRSCRVLAGLIGRRKFMCLLRFKTAHNQRHISDDFNVPPGRDPLVDGRMLIRQKWIYFEMFRLDKWVSEAAG